MVLVASTLGKCSDADVKMKAGRVEFTAAELNLQSRYASPPPSSRVGIYLPNLNGKEQNSRDKMYRARASQRSITAGCSRNINPEPKET
jgi:hypothetical protein